MNTKDTVLLAEKCLQVVKYEKNLIPMDRVSYEASLVEIVNSEGGLDLLKEARAVIATKVAEEYARKKAEEKDRILSVLEKYPLDETVQRIFIMLVKRLEFDSESLHYAKHEVKELLESIFKHSVSLEEAEYFITGYFRIALAEPCKNFNEPTRYAEPEEADEGECCSECGCPGFYGECEECGWLGEELGYRN